MTNVIITCITTNKKIKMLNNYIFDLFNKFLT